MADVLLTGAAGFLGAAVAEALLARGDRVIALVRDRDPRSRLIREGLLARCVELRAELADAERLMAEYRPDVVLHLAAQTQVPISNASPLSTFESNVRGTWRLLEACRLAATPPRAVVVASSDKAYGAAPLPYREDTPLQPEAPYDVSKACTDLIARSYALHFGLPVVVTRCGNLYGPGDLNAQRLVPGVCLALARGEPPTLRSTGAMTREWLYVSDGAAATLRLADALLDGEGVSGEAFNVGGGEVESVRGVVERLRALCPGAPEAQYAEADPAGEIPHQSLDASKLMALGWAPAVGLDEGLRRCWEEARGARPAR
ncbi:MAG: NAD-dependent epimerase/dehydratase family protein [Alphaproteobacteria bacterium]|nr:NAD-dependent epimerase/dehydratase family protein [Alphaproteobacteria bacterium]